MSAGRPETNLLVIEGVAGRIAELRYTPAGIPLLSFSLQHVSEQDEADMRRRVECEVPVIAMGNIANQARQVQEGNVVRVTGFLAKRSLKSAQLVLHVNKLEII